MRTAHSSTRMLWRCLPQWMLGYTPPGLGLDPPGVGLDTSPPPGVGLDTPGQTPQPPPWTWA